MGIHIYSDPCIDPDRMTAISLHLYQNPFRMKLTHLAEVLPHDLNEVWHRKVHDVVPPGGLQHHVRPQQVIAGEQAGGETLLLVLL